MEREYKWIADTEMRARFQELFAADASVKSSGVLQMAAAYYETPSHTLRNQGIALRLRKENERTVCCIKRTLQKEGALAIREEYETEAPDISTGLKQLPEKGAPKDLCIFLSAQTFIIFAETKFTRHWFLLDTGAFTAEFAVDAGMLGNSGNMQPFGELELELKTGDAAAFTAYAEQFQKDYALTPQPLSKLARAAAVGS